MYLSPKACNRVGCSALSCDDKECLDKKQTIHKPPQPKDPHGRGKYSRTSAYNNTRWHKIRKAQISKAPLCQRCLSFNLVTIATDADHQVPHRGDPKIMWDTNNLQSLCRSCHSWKTSEELKGTNHDYRFIR